MASARPLCSEGQDVGWTRTQVHRDPERHNAMTHFALSQWADFSRGLNRDIDRSAMESHLADGCARCRRMVDVLSGVAVAARADAAYEPPDSVVRLAMAIFQPARPTRLTARLIFDSFSQPALAGVRSQDRLTRHSIYEAGNYCVDLRIEHQRAGGTATIVGQLADRDHPGADAAKVRVLLKRRSETVASAACNRFGEFHLDYRPSPSLRLDVCLDASGTLLELPLSGIAGDAGDTRRETKEKKKSRTPPGQAG